MVSNWKNAVVSPETSLGDAIAVVDASGLQVALVVSSDGILQGILTDGNIRRAILAGKSLQVRVSEAMSPKPTTVTASTSREQLLTLMRRKVFHQLPVVDDGGRIVGLVTLDELAGAAQKPNWVVLMAGGLGTRLQPLTNDCPKPLLLVNGKPILETILESFIEQGFQRFYLAVNYKAEMIREYFGHGERWGVQIEYLQEPTQLGTAGALSLLPQRPDHPLLVMNGDLLTRANFENLLQFHADQGADATMAVREYDFQVPYGVIKLDGLHISAIEEKPTQRFFVSAGIYAFSPTALEHIPVGTFFDMPFFFEKLISLNKTAVAYPLREYWLDIGRHEEFAKAQQEWGNQH
jgi:dTDP-glucose pyrophosphorylase/predicted transcriptional regulator